MPKPLTMKQMFAEHEHKDAQRFSELQKAVTDVYIAAPENVAKAVKETVNGKIDALAKAQREHVAKVEPLLENLAATRALGRGVLYVGSFAAAIIAIFQVYSMIK